MLGGNGKHLGQGGRTQRRDDPTCPRCIHALEQQGAQAGNKGQSYTLEVQTVAGLKQSAPHRGLGCRQVPAPPHKNNTNKQTNKQTTDNKEQCAQFSIRVGRVA